MFERTKWFMSKQSISTILIIGGLLIVAVSLAADVIGIGEDLAVIGWKQLTGAGVGIVVFIIGLLRRRKNS